MMRCLVLPLGFCLLSLAAHAQCSPPSAALVPDYAHFVAWLSGGEAEGGTWTATINGSDTRNFTAAETFLLTCDGTTTAANGETPMESTGLAYASGRWGQALHLADDGFLSYAPAGNFDPSEGTIALWAAPRADGEDPIYADHSHYLFHYESGDDYIGIIQSKNSGVIYGGGETSGAWQSAYSDRADTRAWAAGEWHHLAFTYSASGDFMRFYLDGVLMADSNEGGYDPPSAGGAEFSVGTSLWGSVAHYDVDSVRILSRPATAEEIAAWANRVEPPQPQELWLDTATLEPGDSLVFSYTPPGDSPCVSEAIEYPGIPLTNPNPPSTLLPAGSTGVAVAVDSPAACEVRFALGEPRAFADMTPFSATGGTQHAHTIPGLDPDPATVNDVYLRSSAQPDYLLHLRYRAISNPNPRFPRTGNLWGSWNLITKGLEYCARIDLWLGPSFSPDQMAELRRLNPDIRILTSINAVENHGLPEDYYLHDVDGNKVEVWPGSYRLNMTKPEVAEYQARFAYEEILAGDLMFDGCFFDNVMLSQSWQDHDIYGNPFPYDADEDGVMDDPDVLDAAWRAGVLHEMQTFRELMPHALVSGHVTDVQDPEVGSVFNGRSMGFRTADVIEDKMPFHDLLDYYRDWMTLAVEPRVFMTESSPPDQIAYGYGYDPMTDCPPETLEFAEHYYPNMRFGLCFTLLDDGYFAHEYGDTEHGQDWWYDELDFDLGTPLGPAQEILLDDAPVTSILDNGNFEQALDTDWEFWVSAAGGGVASLTRDNTEVHEGAYSARVHVAASADEDWHINFYQADRPLKADQRYAFTFWAKASKPRLISLSAQKGADDWRGYGLYREVALSTEWTEHRVLFTATETATDARIQFFLGADTGTVWVDDVQVSTVPPMAHARPYDYGLVLLNGAHETQNVPLEGNWLRLEGDQAARHEYIVDDAGPAFSATADWTAANYNTGEWHATPPFYHDWDNGCRESSATGGSAQWDLAIPETDTYTLAVWWPAAPGASNWTRQAFYEIVAGGTVAASATLDQTRLGDRWHEIATLALDPADAPLLRVHSGDGKLCIADAVWLRSEKRYNDGSPLNGSVRLQPMDGIILARDSDGDTLSDQAEDAAQPGADADGDGVPNRLDLDSDNDGLPDAEEHAAGTDPYAAEPEDRLVLRLLPGALLLAAAAFGMRQRVLVQTPLPRQVGRSEKP